MKSKITFILCLFFTFSVFAQNASLKYYKDKENKFEGYAVAEFLTNVNDKDNETKEMIESYIFDDITYGTPDVTEIKKLTKNNQWLLEKALSEWEYSDGEYYLVTLKNSFYTKDFIHCVVYINNDEIEWKAVLLNENKLDDYVKCRDIKYYLIINNIDSSEEIKSIENSETFITFELNSILLKNSKYLDITLAVSYKSYDFKTAKLFNESKQDIEKVIRKYFSYKTSKALRNKDKLEKDLVNFLNNEITFNSGTVDVVILWKKII